MAAKISKRFVATYFTGACIVMLFAGMHPGGEGKVAVFAGPWSDPAPQIVVNAGGEIVSTDSAGWMAVTESDGEGLVGRLYASGAVFVASSVVVGACAGVLEAFGEKN